MNLVINKETVSTLKYNGFEVETLIYNSIEVWKKGGEPEPSAYDYQVASTLSELTTDDNIEYSYTYDNSKWYALNTDKQYEFYGIYDETNDINSISKYNGKLAIVNSDDKRYEYQYSNGQWINVGEVVGGFGLIGQIDRDNPPSTFPTDFYVKQSDVDAMGMFDLSVRSPNWRLSANLWGGTDGEYRINGSEWYEGTIEAVNIKGVDYIHFSCPDFPNDSIDVESIDWWNEPMDYYGNSTVMPIQYDKTIFNDYSLYQGYPYNSLDDIEIMGKGVIYNIDGYLYKDNERTTINPYNLGYGILSGTSITEIKLLDENIDTIGDNVFKDCSSLTSIEIPNSVTSIGSGVFQNCTSLTSVTIPNSVTTIGDSAFRECYSLSSIDIPNSVTSIGNNAFNGCSKLTSVTIPNTVTSIGTYAFNNCRSLTSIELPSSLTSINNNVFSNCTSLTSVGIEGSGASVEIPNSVTSIGSGVFQNCTSLTSVTIPNSVRTINGWAFDRCTSLTSVTIPNSVRSIGTYAFNSLPTTGTLYCDEDWFNNLDATSKRYLYNVANWERKPIPLEPLGLYDVRLTLTNGKIVTDVYEDGKIPYAQYSGRTDIEMVEIGDGITQFGYTRTTDMIYYNRCNTFKDCSNLTKIVIGNGIKILNPINSSSATYGSYIFRNCTSLTSVTIPNSVTLVGEGAFSGVPKQGTLYCNEDWFNNLDTTSKNNLGNLKNWTRLPIPS